MSSHLIRQDLIPIAGGYALLMIILAVGLWVLGRRTAAGRPLARATGRRDRGWPALIGHVAADVIGGYVLLMAVVVLYYYGVARVGSSFLASAFSGSALLVGICLPVFLAASWVTNRRRERNRKEDAERPGSG
jgi:hypothetical protein